MILEVEMELELELELDDSTKNRQFQTPFSA